MTETASEYSPNEHYYKTKRTLAVFCGFLAASVFWEATIDENSFLGIKIDTEDVQHVLALCVLYLLYQLTLNWHLQASTVKGFDGNKCDFWISVFICWIVLCAYAAFSIPLNINFSLTPLIAVMSILAGPLAYFIPIKVGPWFIKRREKRFVLINEPVKEILIKGKWDLLFDPSRNGLKSITFLENGEVGDGRNRNEFEWRVVNGFLEIINDGGDIFNRFLYDQKSDMFRATNDQGLKTPKLNQTIRRR